MEIEGKVGRILSAVFRVWTTPLLGIGLRDGKFQVEFGPGQIKTPAIDERIAQIDIAKKSLETALSAIDELKTTARRNREDLNETLNHLQQAAEDKTAAERELSSIKQIAQTDIEVFRKLAGVPSRGDVARERLFGFIIGVVASLIASGLLRFFGI
jgi:gas vesicle protein